MDIYSADKRSSIMSNIRSSGTVPELRLYNLTSEVFSDSTVLKNVKELPGTPDVVIEEYALVFFMDGCFFHACPKHGRIPKSNSEYWAKKIARNVARDRRQARELRRDGYSVWRFWEHDVRTHRALCRTQKRIERAYLNFVGSG